MSVFEHKEKFEKGFLEKINFPYKNLRKGQYKFLTLVHETIVKQKNILINAPTGLGKSVSALAPAISFAKENDLTVICLTSRQTQANQLIKTVRDIANYSKLKINLVSFIGKRNMCVHPDREKYSSSDFNDFCKLARDRGKCQFYKNIRNSDYEEKIKELLKRTSNEFLSVENFVNLASTPFNFGSEVVSGFCPYELAAKKAYKADILICDFNYVFMPGMLENLLGRIGRDLSECIIVVDEAHNLPDRIRSAYSFRLSTELLKNAQKELKSYIKSSKLDQAIISINDTLGQIYADHLIDEKKEYLVDREIFFKILKEKLKNYYPLGDYDNLNNLISDLEDVEVRVKEEGRVISYVGRVANFLKQFKEMDKSFYVPILEKKVTVESTYLTLNVKNLDPSIIASNILNNTYSSILMSATLTPLEMYENILDIKYANLLDLESPFDKNNQLNLVIDDVTTKYSSRSSSMFEKYAKHIENILNAAPNQNAICFFPSYDLMEKILSKLNILKLNRKILKEKRFMTKDEKEKYIDEFKSMGFNSKSTVLFAITSGSFSEGVDLPSNSLELVLIVGLPLSVPDIYVNSLIRYYDRKFQKGQLYGYIYPAMNKIIQAAGRCIRTENDRGAILFLDNRFLWSYYLKAFPIHFNLKKDLDYINTLRNFFK